MEPRSGVVPAGGVLTGEVVLIGHADAFRVDLIEAAAVAALKGLGFDEGRGRARLMGAELLPLGTGEALPVAEGDWPVAAPEPAPPVPPPAPALARVELLSPLRLRRPALGGGRRVLGPAELDAGELMAEAVGRLDHLARLHAPSPWRTDFPALLARARAVRTAAGSLAAVEAWRPGTTGHAPQHPWGVLGTLTLDLAPAPDLWPLLWLAQWTGLGHGAAWGLGQYRVVGEG